MNTFALIVTDRNRHESLLLSESSLAVLRRTFPKALLIASNTVLFRSPSDLQRTFDSLPKSLRRGDPAILIQLGNEFRGTARRDLIEELEKFLAP